ncbi:MAG: hypothetical protein IJU64_00435 [Bacilli bacterium]|nr:hypothetical protein [Bacilli bacterium]
MITIQVLGLDQFVVGRYSREHGANLAQLFETDENDIVFYAPNSMVFHGGVEQTSWQTIVIVRAPEKYLPLEEAVADYLLRTMNLFSINIHLEFEYVSEAHTYDFINSKYPRYIEVPEEKNDDYEFSFGEEPEEMEGEIVHGHDHDHDHEHCDHDHAEEDVYLGDAFAGFEEKYEEAMKKKN